MSLPHHHHLPIEIELGMPSRRIFIATTICQRRSQPSPSTATACTRVDLAPSSRPMPHRSSCEAKLGRENSILARHSKAQPRPEEGPADRLPQAWPSIVGPASSALLADLLAGWDGMGIISFTWPAMTRFPAALRNLVKLERRRGVALVIREASEKSPAPVEKQPAAEPSPGSGGVGDGAAGRSVQAAAKPRSHDGHTMPWWKRLLALGKCCKCA